MPSVSGQVQYMTDSLLIEKIFLIDAGLYKQAGALDLLGGLGSSIKDWGREHIDTSSVGSVLTSLADLMVPGILFKINPLLGGLAAIASALGFNASTIVKRILSFIRPKLENKEEITLDDINSVGKDAVAAEAGSIEAEAQDMFDVLRGIEKRGELVRFIKQAQLTDEMKSLLGLHSQRAQKTPSIPMFGGQSKSVIERVFGQLFKTRQTGKARWLIGGFIVWIMKTVLLGSGLIAGGEALSHLFHKGPAHQTPHPTVQQQHPHDDQPESNEETDQTHEDKSMPASHVSYHAPAATPEPDQSTTARLDPTGNGQDQHANESRVSTWYVPIVGGTIESTLLNWAGYVYRGLRGQESLISSTPAFNRTVQEMRANFEPGAANMQVPSQFKSIKQVVDRFAGDVAAKLQGNV